MYTNDLFSPLELMKHKNARITRRFEDTSTNFKNVLHIGNNSCVGRPFNCKAEPNSELAEMIMAKMGLNTTSTIKNHQLLARDTNFNGI